MIAAPNTTTALSSALLNRKRWRFLGLTLDDLIKYFFNGNAVVAVVVLALITIFLFREGIGFFGMEARNLRVYRLAGLEFVDFGREELEEHTSLVRSLDAARLREFTRLTTAGQSVAAANASLASFDAMAEAFGDAASDVRGLLSDLSEVATALKEKALLTADQETAFAAAKAAHGRTARSPTPVDFDAGTAPLRAALPNFKKANAEFADRLEAALQLAPSGNPQLGRDLAHLRAHTEAFVRGFPAAEQRMQNWRWDEPVPIWRTLTSFLFGCRWLTASFWQDWYGIVPLFVGSLLVSLIALVLAVPLGVSAAIYVSEVAGPRERTVIKPCIEFISAIPSVVLGFFGIAVLGTFLRRASEQPWLSWVPGFPMSERLNSFTAGTLLAFMAVPTIFSLAEDALNNVPRLFKEASFALGANRFQTISHVLVPTALSGIVSAVLLGFGRVIGETMVVLLCAGNRIAIPDFTQGLGAFFQPVHTMTGIVAQEMGEVVPGSIHYRALFMVGVVLFLLALAINFVAQKIVHRYRLTAA